MVMGLWFFARGGSAQVTRYLAPALGDAGWSVSLVAGSLGRPGDGTHAPTFFDGIAGHHLDYDDAVRGRAAAERERRGAHALTHARAELSRTGRVPRLADAYQRAVDHRAERR